jgi:hypothetical protein
MKGKELLLGIGFKRKAHYGHKLDRYEEMGK